MNHIYFTVGPSELHPKFRTFMNQAIKEQVGSMNHRGKEFMTLYEETKQNLKKLLKIPQSYKIFFTASSLESMERILQNCVETHSFHCINGSFSKKWFQFAQALHKKPEKTEVPFGHGFSNVIVPRQAELICLTHNETSTGVSIPMDFIYALRKQNQKALIAIDVVSSAPYPDIDFTNIDCTFFSIQKGFGLPAGLGVVILSERAMKKAVALQKKNISIGSYHSFPAYDEMDLKSQTPETPNVLYIYLLNKVVKDMLKKTLKTIQKETDRKSAMIYDYFDKHPHYHPFVTDTKFRSSTTIVVDVNGKSELIKNTLKSKGFVVGSGYGEFKKQHIRIANLPSHSLTSIKKLLKAIHDLV